MILDYVLLQDLEPQRILFLDVSEYASPPISPTLTVKFPDFKKVFSTPIEFGTINIINTKRLGFSEAHVDFPDGIYEFTFSNATCEEKRKEFIITQALKKFTKIYDNFDPDNKDLLDKINKINLYLHGAKNEVNRNESQAEAYYKQATALLKCI